MPRKKPAKWSNYELAEQARLAKVFDEEFVQTFLDHTENRIYEEWKKAKDSVKREELWLQGQGIEAFRKFIQDTIALGTMAQAEIDAKKERESNQKDSQR